MKIFRKIISVVLILGMFIGIASGLMSFETVCASEKVGSPVIKLKKINSGTGVKIQINKTAGAEGYDIYITKTDNVYSNYMYNYGHYERQIGKIEKDGTKKRTFIIKGLAKGTYTFRVAAYNSESLKYSGENYEYSAEKNIKIKAPKAKKTEAKEYDFKNIKKGDCIKFGHYEQDGNMNNGKEDIEWIVLSKDENHMLVLSKYVLDFLPFNRINEHSIWGNSSIRKWLNKVFYKAAFSDLEKKMIETTKLSNYISYIDSPDLDFDDDKLIFWKDEKETNDKVFLLSLADVMNPEYGFSNSTRENNLNRKASPTMYAINQHMSSYYYSNSMGYGEWWLRTTQFSRSKTSRIYADGNIDVDGPGSDESSEGVRPAMYIILAS